MELQCFVLAHTGNNRRDRGRKTREGWPYATAALVPRLPRHAAQTRMLPGKGFLLNTHPAAPASERVVMNIRGAVRPSAPAEWPPGRRVLAGANNVMVLTAYLTS